LFADLILQATPIKNNKKAEVNATTNIALSNPSRKKISGTMLETIVL
jgi:hypothetical protein